MYIELLLFLFGCKAFAAENGTIIGGLERNSCFLAALSASGREIFSGGSAGIFACVTAGLASLGFILESLFCVKFLFARCENEFTVAVFAY
jgi:hypothetical protein